MVDQNAVMAALQTVNDPELHRSIVALNMVQNLEVDGGAVRFDIVLTTPACPLRATIDTDVRAALAELMVSAIDMTSARAEKSSSFSSRALVTRFASRVRETRNRSAVT